MASKRGSWACAHGSDRGTHSRHRWSPRWISPTGGLGPSETIHPPKSTILLFLLRLLDTMDWVTSLYIYIYNYRCFQTDPIHDYPFCEVYIHVSPLDTLYLLIFVERVLFTHHVCGQTSLPPYVFRSLAHFEELSKNSTASCSTKEANINTTPA